MMVISFYWGRKIYRVPYQVTRILGYMLFAMVLYLISILFKPDNTLLKYVINISFFIFFIVLSFLNEKKRWGNASRV